MTSVSELLPQFWWWVIAGVGYLGCGVAFLARIIVVPWGVPVANAFQPVRMVARAILVLALVAIGAAWWWLALDPDVQADRALWSEGLTPFSSLFPYVLATLPGLDLWAWSKVQRALR